MQHFRFSLCCNADTEGENNEFKLIIDKTKDEEVVATVHERSTLTDELERLVMQHTRAGSISAYTEDDMKVLKFPDIECITVLDGKTYAIDIHNK